MSRRASWLLASGLALLLSGGCGGGPQPGPQPGPTSRPASRPVAEASPSPAASPAPKPVDPVVQALGQVLDLEDRRVSDLAAWEPLLTHESARVRRYAARGLGRVRAAPSCQVLLARLKVEEDRDVRRELVFALGQVGDAAARDALLELLHGEGSRLPALAAQALGKLPHDMPTVAALVGLAASDGSPAVRGAALLALVRLRGRRADPAEALPADLAEQLGTCLIELVGADTEPRLRWRAVYALSEIELPDRRQALLAALDAPDPASRLFAARGLLRLGGIAGPMHAWGEAQTLVEHLEAETDPHVAAALCDVLGDRGSAQGMYAMAELVERREPPQAHHVRVAALKAIRAICVAHEDDEHMAVEDKEHGLRAAREALRDPSPRVRSEALFTMTRLRDLDAPGRASAFARRADPYDREAAARAAPQLPDSAAGPILKLLMGDGSPRVVCAALAALGERAERQGAGQEDRLQQALQACRRGLQSRDLAVLAMSLALLGEVGGGDDVARAAQAYHQASGPEQIEVRQEALRAAASLTLRSRSTASSFFSAGFRAELRASSLLNSALTDPAPAVQVVAAAQLERLYGERPPTPAVPVGRSTVALDPAQDLPADDEPNPRVEVRTSKGSFELELLRDQAPRHVASFLRLSKAGFYDGLCFHRVESGFVVQGLDPRGDGWGTGGVVLHDEINAEPFLEGTVGMPNAGPDTGGCQLFVTLMPAPHLDGTYTVFAKVCAGMDVVNSLDVGDVCLGVEAR